MGRTKIRWKYLGRVAAGVALAIATISFLPGLLAPPEPPPLPDDIGLRTGATGAFARLPAPVGEGDTRPADEGGPRGRGSGELTRRDEARAAEPRREREGGEKAGRSASDADPARSAPGPAHPPSVTTAPTPAASPATAAPQAPASPPPIAETGSSSSGSSAPNTGSGADGYSGSAANAGAGAGPSAPQSASAPTQFSFEH